MNFFNGNRTLYVMGWHASNGIIYIAQGISEIERLIGLYESLIKCDGITANLKKQLMLRVEAVKEMRHRLYMSTISRNRESARDEAELIFYS